MRISNLVTSLALFSICSSAIGFAQRAAGDHPDRRRVDEEVPAFGNQPDVEPELAKPNGRLQPGETTSEHQRRSWHPWSNLLLSVLRLHED
jgi:hypothetical protein